MKQETEMLFAHIMKDDLSVLELLLQFDFFGNSRPQKHLTTKAHKGVMPDNQFLCEILCAP